MKNRLKNLRDKLGIKNTDALLISSISNIIYLTGYNGFSNEEREAYLLITKNAQYIFTDSRYSIAIEEKVSDFILLKIGAQKPFLKILEDLIKDENIVSLGIEAKSLTVIEYLAIKKIVKCNPVDSILQEAREKKEEIEINSIKKACDIGDNAFKYILGKINEGISEKEIAYYLENYIRQNGGEPSFRSIVAFEKNAAIPHHLTGDDVLKNKTGQYVLMDFGVKIDNYCSDMTRTIFFGTPSSTQILIYNTVKESQEKAIKLIISNYRQKNNTKINYHKSTMINQKGISASKIDKIARDYIISMNYPSIPHSLGHGIGLDVHEYPSLSPKSKDFIQNGMIFSIEPGIYIPSIGGVRIEDLIAIRNNVPEILTHASKNLTII